MPTDRAFRRGRRTEDEQERGRPKARASDVLAGLRPLERQAAMAVLMRGPMARWAEGTSGPLHTGSAGLTLVKSGRVEVVATTEDARELVLAEAGDGEVLTCPPAGLREGDVVLRALDDSWLCPLDHAHLRDLARVASVTRPGATEALGRLERAGRLVREADGAVVLRADVAAPPSCRQASQVPSALARILRS